MDFHEAANIFPMEEETIAALAEDIRKNGQQQAIELLNGKIVDGRRRWTACRCAGIKPRFHELDPATVPDPVAYVLSLNLHRRHLSTSQRAMVAARAREIYDRDAKDRQKAAGGDRKSAAAKSVQANLPEPIREQARDQAGKALGVSGKTVDHATTVLEKGSPELVRAVEAGRVAVSRAARIATSPAPAANPANAVRCEPTPEPSVALTEGSPPELLGKGVLIARKALDILKGIPLDDKLRAAGFKIVTDWIKHNS